jgi:ferritin-like metal-binding protein YciE
MPDPNERDAKLIQYLSEAYGKERELEVALQTDIAMTTKAPYKKRLQQHLKETKAHAKALDRRIRKLGGGGQTVQTLVGQVTAVAKGPLHMIRGSGEQEKLLKNAKTQFTAEQEEISTYLAIEVFATKVADPETAKLARDIRKEEERMAKFLETQIRQLAGSTALEEVPVGQRRGTPERRRATNPRKSAAKKSPPKKSAAKPKRSAAKGSPSKSASKSKAGGKSPAKKRAAKKAPSKKSKAKS